MASETPQPPQTIDSAPNFTSSHTANFPELLRQLGISLLVTTYQAGKLIIVRAQGDSLNTHFCQFMSPMGLAYDAAAGKLCVGTRHEVWELRNQPEVAPKLEPPGHDAAFLPRARHYSGDIRIHEIGWGADDELWAVNTRFSCLCTFDSEHSFYPRWRPPFITGLTPEDRCHLNGLAMVEGKPRYATCLGATDAPHGWRQNKRNGGCLLEIPSGEILLSGLSMPHSPRVYDGRFWFLESGYGSLSTADLATGATEIVLRMPGFTRGLDFFGNLAFIGLSQIRETATFSGLPITEDLPQRTCGVWVVDIRTGKTVAFLRFEGVVQEIFAIQVLPQIRCPDVIVDPGPILDLSYVLPDEALACP